MKIKKFFNSPKKALATISIMALTLCLIGAISIFTVYAVAESSSIGEEAAVSNAYAAAGITSDEVDAVHTKFKFEDGKFVYDVEFYVGGLEYEYTIKSSDGTIVESDHPDSTAADETIITVEKAKEIALAHAGVSAENATFTKAKLDKDDGNVEYEIEFQTSDKKYEYDISATDGAVKKTEIKSLSQTDNSQNSENLITVDEAKAKVLADLGVENVTFTKAKLDKDDGKYTYEINFILNDKKYEYEIDAVTGDIVKYEDKVIDSKKEEETSPENLIGAEAAKAAALAHANMVETDVSFIKAELEKEDGIFIYEVEFETADTEYEYDINAVDGSIIKSEAEAKKSKDDHKEESQDNPGNAPQGNPENAPQDTTNIPENKPVDNIEDKPQDKPEDLPQTKPEAYQNITADKAKEIAFANAGVKNPEMSKEAINDDGKYVFEFTENGFKYKYEINPETGAITEKKMEAHNKTETLIGLDQAKQTALDKISASKEDVIFTKAKLEKDHNNVEFEIEFIYNNVEYDFCIDAMTGEIVEWKIDE